DRRWFVGLASPAAAGLMASFVWTCHELGYAGEDLRYGALAVTVIAGLLMVSRLRYSSFKGSGSGAKAERVPFVALLIALGVLIALWLDPPKTLLAAAALYALSGPVMWFRRRHDGGRAESACAAIRCSASSSPRWGIPSVFCTIQGGRTMRIGPLRIGAS